MGEKFDELCDDVMTHFMDHSGIPVIAPSGKKKPYDVLSSSRELLTDKSLEQKLSVLAELAIEGYKIDSTLLEGLLHPGKVSIDEVASIVVASCVREELMHDQVIAEREKTNIALSELSE